jgi:hypothetical protein
VVFHPLLICRFPGLAPPGPAPLPSRITELLRGAGDHQRPLRTYEQMLQKLKKEPPDGR